MTKKQKAEVLELIAKDCEVRFTYINAQGQTCAIGHLAKAAGCPLDDLIVALAYDVSAFGPNVVDTSEPRKAVGRMQEAIKQRFGLLYMHQRDIQSINDSNKDRTNRIKAITAFVEGLLTED